MRIVVTGAAGQLGSRVVPTLVALGHEVVATDRRPGDGIVPCELADLARLTSLCRGAEAIVHLATSAPPERARPRPTNQLAENLLATTNVARASRATGVRRVVHASSIQVIASEDYPHLQVAYLPLDSRSPPNPRNPYGMAKLAEETLLRELGDGHWIAVSLRFPFLFEHLPEVPAGRRLLPLSKPERTSDLAQGLCCLSFRDAANLIAACLTAVLPGHRTYLPALSVVPPEFVPAYLARYYGEVELRVPPERMTSLIDLSELERELGWKPLDLSLHPPPPDPEETILEDPPPTRWDRAVQRLVHWQERLARARRRRWAAAQLAREPRPVFATDYVTAHTPNWIRLFNPWRNQPGIRFLLIGGYDGRSALWLLENLVTHETARLTCVGSFGDPLLDLRFDHNLQVSGSGNRAVRLEGRAASVLPSLPSESFHLIYLDGSYLGPRVEDAGQAWKLLEPGGVLLLDGYFVEGIGTEGFDRFLGTIADRSVVLHRSYQVAIRKT